MRLVLFAMALLLVVGSAALGADDPAVIFSDNFATLDPGWGGASAVQSVAGGKLVFQPPANRTYTSLYQGTLFRDADIRVKVCETDGGTDNTAGLVFWASDTQNYYLAQVEPDGYVGVTRWMQGQQVTPVGYSIQPAVAKGVGQVNALRVVTVGKWAAVYVNDKQIAAFKGFPPEGGSQIGLHAESGDKAYTWQFSNLLVRKPDPGLLPAGSSTPAADPALVFADDFSMLDPGWGAASDAKRAEGGKLVVRPDPHSGRTSLYTGSLFGDADIRVNVCETDGGTDSPAGIVFWAVDTANFYVAQAEPDGTVGVTRWLQGQQVTPVGYNVQDAVAKGVGQVNSLRVVTVGNGATVYVNDKQIASFKGFPPAGGSMIGLHAESSDKPFTWQFSDLQVRKPTAASSPASSSAAADPSVMFSDNFAKLDPAWGTPDDVQSASGGKLLLQPKLGTSYASLYRGTLFGDADIRIKVSEASGGSEQPAGIIFSAADFENYYVAQVSPGGNAGLSHLEQGKWTAPVPYFPREAAKKGPGVVNELRVVAKGNSITFYVNDQQIATIKGSPPQGGGKIGVRAVSGDKTPYTWQFSDLVVRKPQ